MKKSVLFMLIIGLVFMVAACNEPGGNNGGDDDNATDIVYSWGTQSYGYRDTPDSPNSNDNYPGIMVTLAECPSIEGTWGDLSLYGSVALEAYLYADSTTTQTVAAANGLGHFKLLTGNNWEADSIFAQVDNMEAAGETSATRSLSEKPVYLLVQTKSDTGVNSIEICKLTIRLRTDLPSFDKVYDKGNYISVTGNKITFTGAQYDNSGLIYYFDEDSDLPLTGKTVTFSYKIENYNKDDGKHYQFNVQAAWGINEDQYNNANPDNSNGNVGQFYPVLDDNIGDDGTGSFNLEGNKIIAAAEAKGGTVTALRFSNNGKAESPLGQMETDYTITINAITVH